MIEYKSKKWTLNLPESWIDEIEDNIHLFYDPNGVGALQISTYTKNNGIVTTQELLENTELPESDHHQLTENDWGIFHGYQLIYSEDDTFWRKWWLMNQDIFLFITYNCELDKKELEFEIVNNILDTLNRIKT